MPDDVKVVWSEAELAGLLRQQWLRRALDTYGANIARTMAQDAPRDTGAGADSIHQETAVEAGGWASRVSWDREHDYMRFPNSGTRFMHGQHFLERAVERYAR